MKPCFTTTPKFVGRRAQQCKAIGSGAEGGYDDKLKNQCSALIPSNPDRPPNHKAFSLPENPNRHFGFQGSGYRV